MNWIIAGVAVLAIALGGAYYASIPDDAKEGGSRKDGAMMEKDTSMDADVMMETHNTASDPDGSMTEKQSDATTGETTSGVMQKGSYEAYAPGKLAKAATGDVVLFFRAPWCPTCRALDADIRANLDGIPADITILDVDYDSETALKQKYGVTYQHTLVQVDASGKMITKWSGGLALRDILSKLQ